ncbi:MAG TPA: nuclear transport factor 2 family protein [Dongiaceae bacterium]|nr:nuclear transport factor 2 family protein [Dongiaceae bacterium]HVY98162.1 nuclear transport factor 2 family protein [Dongiaceae bacterium]
MNRPVSAAPGLDLRDVCNEAGRAAIAAATAKVIAYWDDECARDLPRMMAHFTPDVEVVTPDGSYRGHDAVAALYRKSFDAYPGLTVDVKASFAGRDAHCVEYRAVLHDAENKPWLIEGINLMRLKDGRIAYLRSFEDAPRPMTGGD